MKAIYYLVTFLAAVVVLAFAGWTGYCHYQAGNFNHLLPAACCSKACPLAKPTHCKCGCTDDKACSCKDCDHPKN